MSAILTVLLFAGILTVWLPGRMVLSLWQACIFVLSAAWIGGKLWKPGQLAASVPLIPLAAVIFWGLLQLALGWSVYRQATWQALLDWLSVVAVFWLASEVFATRSSRDWLRRSLLSFGFLIGALATVQRFTAPQQFLWLFPVDSPNAMGPFPNRDHYSVFIELLLPLALWTALRDRGKALSHSLMAGVMFASVIASASRAGSILVTLEVVVALFLGLVPRLRGENVARRAIAWTSLFVVIFVAIVGWEALWERFKDPDPFMGRRELLQSSLAMVRERRWHGFGIGTWSTVYPSHAVTDFGPGVFVNHAHNDWVQWTAEGGVPLLALLLIVAGWTARRAIHSSWSAGVLAAFCHATVDFPFQRPALAAVVFALLGVEAAAANASKTAAVRIR